MLAFVRAALPEGETRTALEGAVRGETRGEENAGGQGGEGW